MNKFNRRKMYITAGVISAAVLLILFLYALFLPGVWHGDAFLYQKGAGSFAGSDVYADYKMNIKQTENGADISFSVNGERRTYSIVYDSEDINRSVKIIENGSEIFNGRAIGEKNNYILVDEQNKPSGNVSIRVGNERPEELFPGCRKLYNWSVSKKYDTRGDPAMLFFILLFTVILVLDIKFPTLFWILRHRSEVDGGEPSDWYYFGQKIGRGALVSGIFICIILTFTIH